MSKLVHVAGQVAVPGLEHDLVCLPRGQLVVLVLELVAIRPVDAAAGASAPGMPLTFRARLPSWSWAIAWSSATIAAQPSCGPDDAGGAVGAACCIGIAGMLGGVGASRGTVW